MKPGGGRYWTKQTQSEPHFSALECCQEPQRTEIRQVRAEYVDVRLAAVQEGKLESSIRRSTELHDQLWKAAVTAAEKDPRSIPTGLFIQSLNELIDLHAKRLLVAIGSRIPMIVWLVLFTVAVLSFGSMGYHSGLTGARRSPVVLTLALTFASSCGWSWTSIGRKKAFCV